nr:uncharacterized protein LOC109167539 [Ipomoea batatas]
MKFESEHDLDFTRFEGPWMIMDHYLVVQEWGPNFDPSENKIEKLIVWLRLPSILIEYFDEEFLKKISKQIGRPIDVTKPLVAKFNFLNKLWPVEYERIHLVCFQCGLTKALVETPHMTEKYGSWMLVFQGWQKMLKAGTIQTKEVPHQSGETSNQGGWNVHNNKAFVPSQATKGRGGGRYIPRRAAAEN